MRDVIDSLLSNVERFLRWVYPGFLLLVLLHFGRTISLVETLGLDQQSGPVQILGLSIAIVVSSAIIYILHRYVIQEMIFEYGIFYLLCGWGPVAEQARLQELGRRQVASWTNRLLWWHFWRWNVDFQRSKFGYTRTSDTHIWNFITYNWAVTHAIGISWWMLLITNLFAEPWSEIRGLRTWIWPLTGLLLFAWLWQVGNNTYGDISIAKRPGPTEGTPT